MKKLITIILSLLLVISIAGCSQGPTYNYGEEPAEDYLEDGSLYFGRGEEVAPDSGGLALYEYADSADCTLKDLAAWYKQDVKDKDYTFAMIYYEDQAGHGVHAANNVISTNIIIDDGAYVDDTPQTEVYVYENGKLKKQ